MKIVLASSNPGKQAELGALLGPAGVRIVPQDALGVESPEETGLTFIENALIKARAACEASGLPALADDSGIVVDALGGAPGVHSARYAGDGATDADNVARLLESLEGVAAPARGAAFVCAIAYLRHARDPRPIVCEGIWAGRILDAPRGTGGFGYDPVFFVESLGRTAAELSCAEKNAASHRGQALLQLLDRLAHIGTFTEKRRMTSIRPGSPAIPSDRRLHERARTTFPAPPFGALRDHGKRLP